MASARDSLVEVSFVSHVRGRAIQLFDESEHFADLRPDETVTVQTPPRRNWSARCDGVTVVLWPVPAGGAAFELGADAKLPQARARRSTAGTRPSGLFRSAAPVSGTNVLLSGAASACSRVARAAGGWVVLLFPYIRWVGGV